MIYKVFGLEVVCIPYIGLAEVSLLLNVPYKSPLKRPNTFKKQKTLKVHVVGMQKCLKGTAAIGEQT